MSSIALGGFAVQHCENSSLVLFLSICALNATAQGFIWSAVVLIRAVEVDD